MFGRTLLGLNVNDRRSLKIIAVQLTVEGFTRLYPTDDVKVYYATNEEHPSLIEIPFKEFEEYERAFPHEIWDALVSQQ